jgi:hypothetical protein
MGPSEGIYVDRIREHTAPPVNARIDEVTGDNIRRYSAQHVGAISRRLRELDREWDLDRALIALFAGVGTLVLELGLRKRRGFFWVLHAQLAFLAVHATLGWSPPVPVLRRLGFRTSKEIGVERRALLDALRLRLGWAG